MNNLPIESIKVMNVIDTLSKNLNIPKEHLWNVIQSIGFKFSTMFIISTILFLISLFVLIYLTLELDDVKNATNRNIYLVIIIFILLFMINYMFNIFPYVADFALWIKNPESWGIKYILSII